MHKYAAPPEIIVFNQQYYTNYIIILAPEVVVRGDGFVYGIVEFWGTVFRNTQLAINASNQPNEQFCPPWLPPCFSSSESGDFMEFCRIFQNLLRKIPISEVV